VIVSTSGLAESQDNPNCCWTAQTVASNVEESWQMVGRAGRGGQRGLCILATNYTNDMKTAYGLLTQSRKQNAGYDLPVTESEKIAWRRILQVLQLADGSACAHQAFLTHFEAIVDRTVLPHDRCCSTCTSGIESVTLSAALVHTFLERIWELIDDAKNKDGTRKLQCSPSDLKTLMAGDADVLRPLFEQLAISRSVTAIQLLKDIALTFIVWGFHHHLIIPEFTYASTRVDGSSYKLHCKPPVLVGPLRDQYLSGRTLPSFSINK
jgi:hypothetical protein